MAVNPVGVTQNTPERMLLDAGAIYKNLTYDDTTGDFTGEVLGATSGGNEFQVEIETRQPELDGVKTRIRGLKFVNSHEAQLTVNLKELTAQNIKNAIGPADIDDTDSNFDIVTGRSNIEDGDYLDNIAFVGRLSGNDRPVVILLKNALSAEGFTMSTEDDGEAVVPIVFHAHADFEDIESGKVAYQVYWPKETTT
ncbi:hypothetical protein [Sediminibacillus massiliensis]|uniref:hypothetical protein n=1 Tax=Sediminibacillus massiliensis TaxID=1926277 RepID=UPI0009883A7E|nr:hypothetical protein [Sediminibacillus massiliensis]